jgi:hypothetical protein
VSVREALVELTKAGWEVMHKYADDADLAFLLRALERASTALVTTEKEAKTVAELELEIEKLKAQHREDLNRMADEKWSLLP